MDAKEKVLQAMKEAKQPVSAGEVEKITGLDRKTVDKVFDELKKANLIESPIRCKWQPK